MGYVTSLVTLVSEFELVGLEVIIFLALELGVAVPLSNFEVISKRGL